MTAQRIIKPELRSIPLTFRDCLDREDHYSWMANRIKDFCKITTYENVKQCDYIRANGKCPRGFA